MVKKSRRTKPEVVPLAEVRRLTQIADELREVATDAQANADTAARRANAAHRKADSATRTKRNGDINR
jgi:hypothetical protein